MFEEYKKEIIKYDIQLRLNNFFKGVFWGVTILACIILFFSCNIWLKLLIILIIELLVIIIGLIIFCFLNVKNSKSIDKKSKLFARLKAYIKYEEKERIKYFVSLLKKYNVNTENKIFNLLKLNNMQKNKLILSETQSIFGLFVIFMAISSDYYNTDLNSLDINKFSFGLSFTILAIIIYGILKLFKYIIYSVLFSTDGEINSNYENALLYFYLNFEEYKEELKIHP